MRLSELQIAYIMKQESPNTNLQTRANPACSSFSNCLDPAWLSLKLHINPLVMLFSSLAKVNNKTNIALLKKAISHLDIKINLIGLFIKKT